jgi:chaperonin GroES
MAASTKANTAKSSHIMATAKPLGDRVVIRADRVAEESPGGIILPDAMQRNERPQFGEVMAVGPGRKFAGSDEEPVAGPDCVRRVPVDVKVGDRVLFALFAGSAVADERCKDETWLIIREEDVMAVLPRREDDGEE